MSMSAGHSLQGGGQQDSHELLRCLLAGLQSEECSLLKVRCSRLLRQSHIADIEDWLAAETWP